MQTITIIQTLKNIIFSHKKQGKTIGFVPTMGYLHEGHLSLIRRAKDENDFVVVSIFVNPTQFGANEDLDKYPRNLARDEQLAEGAGANIIFAPTVDAMYPSGYNTYVNVKDVTKGLCGASRPGHFEGVTTVVTKLFNIVAPNKAYFGQKDAQQAAVIQRMVLDLNMNLEVVVCPIVREADGLAMSSRNVYLSNEERQAALVLSRSLFEAQDKIKNNSERDAHIIRQEIIDKVSAEPLADIDYIEIVDGITLKPLDVLNGKFLIALAVKFGKTRLIDNVMLEVK